MESNKNVAKIISRIVDIVIWVFVIFAVVITALVFSMQSNADGIPSVFGKSLITIISDSMKPEFKTGDLIILNKLNPEDLANLEEGDIITFHSSQDLNGDGYTGDIETHRIIKKQVDGNNTYYTTQGDNREMSQFPDPPIRSTEVIGVFSGTKLPGVGGFIGFLSSSTGFFFFIVLPMILFFLYGLINFIVVLLKTREKPAPVAAPAVDEEEIKRRAIEEYIKSQQAQNNENVASDADSDKKEN